MSHRSPRSAAGRAVTARPFALPPAVRPLALAAHLAVLSSAGMLAGWSPAVMAQAMPAPASDDIPAGALASLPADRSDAPGQAAAGGPSAPGAEAALPEASVTVTADRMGKTEGTGSFTTRSSAAATGLNLSLRETPQSVTVITRARMDEAGINALGDALAQAPGIVYTPAGSPVGGYASLSARGYPVSSLILDGVPLPASAMAGYAAIQGLGTLNTDVYDSVTVVRGATGLMTGAGDPSAAVALTRKRPTETLQATVSQSLGSWRQRRTVGDVGGPLNEAGTLRGRIVGAYEAGESWKQGYRYHKTLGYGVLEADLGSQTVARLHVQLGDNDAKGGAGPYTGYALADVEGNPTPFGRGDNSMAEWSGFDDSRTGLTAALEHRFSDGWKATLAYNHNRVKTRQRFGLASLEPEVGGEATLHIRGYRIENTANSAGAKLDGHYALFGRKHDLAVGLDGSSVKENAPDWYRNMARTVNILTWNRQFPEPDWASLYGFGWRRKIEQAGAYAATRLNVTDSLSVLAGGRWTDWRSRTLDEAGSVLEDRKENGVFTPYVGLVFDLTPSISAYASHTTIFNPQSNRDVNGDLLDPEEGSNTEAGLKGEWLGGSLNASVAVFEVKKDNLALQDGANLTPTGDDAYIAADDTKGRGWELEVAGEPVKGWRLQGGYARMLTRDSAGERLNGNLPEHQFKLFTSWTPAAMSQLTVGGGVTWQSRTYSPWLNEAWRDRYAQKAYSVANLMARYKFGRQLTLTVNLNNAFDKVYRTDLDVHDYGAPRNVLATLHYAF